MGAVRALRKIQRGKESTRGTGVAATARRIGDVTFGDASEKVTPERDYGSLTRAYEPGHIVRQLTEMTIETEVSYEQILDPLRAGLKGGVTGSEQTMGQGDYLYTFTPSLTADPAPDSFTLEYIENDGSSNVQTLEATYGLCRMLRISANRDAGFSTMTEEWFARGATSQTPTASIGIPSRTLVPGSKWQVYLATTFAGLSGASALDGMVVGFEWEMDFGLAPKFRLDDDSVDFAAYQFARRAATLRLTLDLNSTSEGERATYFRDAVRRFVRLQVTGPQIGAGDNHRITIDGSYELVGPVESGNEDEGQSTVELEYQSIEDPTSGKDVEISVLNSLSALP